MPKILIIEDNLLDIEITSELLKNAGYDILIAQNAQDGITQVLKYTPDLILMDINLPDFSGIEATKRLKADPRTTNVPIIAHTVCVLPEETKNIYMAGCTGIIPKPIDIINFIPTIQKYLEIGSKIEAQNLTPKQPKEEKSDKDEKTHKILIIDDNQINAELLNAAMEQIKKSTRTAYCGKQAIKIAQQEKFDLILLDIMMPEMSGFDVIEKMRNTVNKNTPVVFISALNETKDIVKGLNLGSYDYITKPYNVEELQARVQGILRTKDLQDCLRYEKEKWDKINRYSADGIVMLDNELKITSCNQKICELLNNPEQEIVGNSFCSFFKLNENNCSCENIPQLKECIDNKNNSIKNFILEKENRKLFFEINCSKIKSTEKNEYIFILRDVTKEKEIEQQKETFIATLTHDLKTPVRAEMMSLSLLLQGKFGQLNFKQKEIMQEILNSSKFMFRMIDTLLAKYKYENGKIELQKENILIEKLIDDCLKEIRPLANSKNQKLFLNLYDKSSLLIDGMEMKRLLNNLLINAVNYTQENGEIIIKTEALNDKFKISITDNGPGISQEKIETLFDKYISYAKTFRSVGTGLGLYLVKQIANAHGGEISVNSEVNAGTTFTLTLPQLNVALTK